MAPAANANEPSLMTRKFLMGGAWEPDPDTKKALHADSKKPLFFYGTLMDPSTLGRVIRKASIPVLEPAKVFGFTCKMWGPYPALVEGTPDSVVVGMMYKPTGIVDRLFVQQYETGNYTLTPCQIVLGDGTKREGYTFVWAGEKAELKEGKFDLKEWLSNRPEE